MKALNGKKIIDVDIMDIVSGYSTVVIDIGTGDGRFVYKKAKECPEAFFIGIDPAAENMVEFSSKVIKKPSKGGLSNVLYAVSSVEGMPDDMKDIAAQIYVNLPWGSLLEGIIKGNEDVLNNIVKTAKPPEANLDFCFTYNDLYEVGEMNRRDLPELSHEYINTVMKPLYESKGIIFKSADTISNETLREYGTQWAKRLGFGRTREVYRVSAIILK